MLLNIILIMVGLVILIAGAEGLVRGAASLAAKLRIAPLIIGLTVVSFGTSAPELTVNILSAVHGSGDLALGNVLGSNTANVLLVLGIVAIITPLTVKSSTVWKEIPFALLGAALLLVMANDVLLGGGGATNVLTRTDGLILMALMGVFMYYVIRVVRQQRSSDEAILVEEGIEDIKVHSFAHSGLLFLGGLAGLMIGGHVLVDSAVSLAQAAGFSEAFIGLTIIAIGTSLPELATSVVAALRKHADIAIGNIVGSNIFNIFWVLGLTSTILPLPINSEMNIDILVALGATFLLFAYMFVGGKHRLIRWEGVSFVLLYIAYMTFLAVRG